MCTRTLLILALLVVSGCENRFSPFPPASEDGLDGEGVAYQVPKWCPYMISAEAGNQLISLFAPGSVTVTIGEGVKIAKDYCAKVKELVASQDGNQSKSPDGSVAVVYNQGGKSVTITAHPAGR